MAPKVSVPLSRYLSLLGGIVLALAMPVHWATASPASVAWQPEAPTAGAPISYTFFLPLIERHQWEPTALPNGDFEGGTWRKTRTGQEYGEISVPEHWVAFWVEGGTANYGRPEMRVIPRQRPYLNPPRIYEGQQAVQWFTFWRNGDVGLYQQIPAESGAMYRATAFVHVWYSQLDTASLSQYVDWSSGSPMTYTIQDGDPGMMAMLGIDPTGGDNADAPTVIWAQANIYDQYDSLQVQATAQAPTITVFLRTVTLYPFKHCDAYWDDVTLEVMR